MNTLNHHSNHHNPADPDGQGTCQLPPSPTEMEPFEPVSSVEGNNAASGSATEDQPEHEMDATENIRFAFHSLGIPTQNGVAPDIEQDNPTQLLIDVERKAPPIVMGRPYLIECIRAMAAELIAKHNRCEFTAPEVLAQLHERGLFLHVRKSNGAGDVLGKCGLRLAFVKIGGRRAYDLRGAIRPAVPQEPAAPEHSPISGESADFSAAQ